VIGNATFQAAGSAPGEAVGWTLRSFCAREAIASFAPGESVEGFERWTPWTGALDLFTRAPIAPAGTMETFEAWPVALFAFELTGGLVAGSTADAFETSWWTGATAFAWAAVPQGESAFASAPQEVFASWRPGEVYALAFVPTSLAGAAFKEGAVELFDGAAWPTKNTTFG
jgi:hypothetical protein